METPTSDFASNGDITPSDSSTPPTPYEPFQPQFKVKVTEPIKNGEILSYTVKTTRIEDEKEYSVVREYEDFEYLHHCLLTNLEYYGLIIPPLPIKAPVEAKGAESKSKKQLGNSKILIGDEFHKDCRGLQRYLRQLVAHAGLGTDTAVENFLLQKEPPPRMKIKKGILDKISSAVEEVRKSNHRDIDDYFQKERDNANEYAILIREASNSFNRAVYAQQRIASAYGHLSTALNLGGGYRDDTNAKANKLLVRFSEALDDSKHGADVDVANDENTLGFHLDLAARFAEAVKEMHYRRTCLLIDYEESNRNLAKAKPHKLAAAEDAKIAAEQAFEQCTDVARTELQTHQRQHLLDFQEALELYAEAKIKTARDTYALLTKSLVAFKQMSI